MEVTMMTWMDQPKIMSPPCLVEEERGRAGTATEKQVEMEQGGAVGVQAVVTIVMDSLLVTDLATTALCTA